MGCDINVYKEKLVAGKWMSADELEKSKYSDEKVVPWRKRFIGRNYQLFGLLHAGVRSEHPFSFEGRGLPFDISPEVAGAAHDDGHSHSYLYLHELKAMRAFMDTQTISISGMKDAAELKLLRESLASDAPDWNLLYPYCGWTSAPGAEEFALEVPASFYLGPEMDELIAMFDGVDGDNQRLVFWFYS